MQQSIPVPSPAGRSSADRRRRRTGALLAVACFLGLGAAAKAGLPPLSIQAPAKSKEAYVIFIRERTRDASELKTYSQKAPTSLTGQPVTLLAVYGRQEVLEGAQMEGVVLLRFPSFDAAKAWYDGPAYREARKHRFSGADYRAVIVEGV